MISDDDVKKTTCYRNCETMLAIAISERDAMKLELDMALQSWSAVKGDLLSARKNIDELVDKHNRRWKELLAFDISITASVECKDLEDALIAREADYLETARKISGLENKLSHALDAIRQSDLLRVSLTDATNLNEIYQAKIEDLKLKISQLSSEKIISDRPVSSESTINDATSVKPHKADQSETGSSNNGDEKAYRKMKKDLSAAILSKDQAKGKLEVSKRT